MQLAFSAARVDGPLNDKEKVALLTFAAIVRGGQKVEWFDPFLQQGLGSHLAPHEEIDKLVEATKSDAEMWLCVQTSLLSLLVADGQLNDSELEWLKRFHGAAGTRTDYVMLLVRLYEFRSKENGQSPGKSESILDIPQGADLATIKKAYRHKANEFHPDKLNDVSEGVRKLAEQKLKEINEAYERLTTPGQPTDDVPHLFVFDGNDWKPLKSMQAGVVVCCPICAQKNRLPATEKWLIARCGACHAYLGLSEDQLDFLSSVTKSDN